MNKVNFMPEGFHSVTPYLSVKGAAEAIEFYKRVFDAKERYRLPGPDGKTVGHAEIMIGDSILMLAEENPQWGNKSPKVLNGTPVNLVVYVPDADQYFKRAVDAGAKVIRPVADQFYGDRSGCVEDPFGFSWSIMTHIEDVSQEEIERRLPLEYKKMAEQQG
ncbi:MAG: VOC family protein [Candidatus Omnitrophica bacterium]|nr:VOC family protein [Candidatus Omnitrophota bacterium]